MSVRQSPMGMPAKPTAAPFEVVPMITYKKKKVAMTSIRKHSALLQARRRPMWRGTYAVDAATISRLAAASPFEQGAVGDLR